MKQTVYMMSDFPPWQVYRWRLDHEQKIDVIERFDLKKDDWVTHDNDLLRGAFMQDRDAGLSNIDKVAKAQARTLTVEGPA